jgi:hypothetical protein
LFLSFWSGINIVPALGFNLHRIMPVLIPTVAFLLYTKVLNRLFEVFKIDRRIGVAEDINVPEKLREGRMFIMAEPRRSQLRAWKREKIQRQRDQPKRWDWGRLFRKEQVEKLKLHRRSEGAAFRNRLLEEHGIGKPTGIEEPSVAESRTTYLPRVPTDIKQ